MLESFDFSIDSIGVLLSSFFGQPFIQALAVPVGFYIVGGVAKKIIRGATGNFFHNSDWFLAPDALLASMGSLIIQALDLVGKFNPDAHTGRVRVTLILLAINFFTYIAVLATHAHYEKPSVHSDAKKFWMLVVIANLLAFFVMFISILGIRGAA